MCEVIMKTPNVYTPQGAVAEGGERPPEFARGLFAAGGWGEGLDWFRDAYISDYCHLEGGLSDAVYRYYDGGGVLLYVGIANDFLRRHEQHKKGAGWHHHARVAHCEIYPWRLMAEFVERCAIENEAPEFNRLGSARGAIVGKSMEEFAERHGGRLIGYSAWFGL